MHFTRMGGYGQPMCRSSCAARVLPRGRERQALPRCPCGPVLRQHRLPHGEEIGQAALEQMRELPFYTNWSYAHPRAIELAAEVASLAPATSIASFFVSGGSEAVESAWKLARQYYLVRGEKRLRTVLAEPETYHDACRRRSASAAAVQGDRPPRRLPRDDHGSALDQRDPRDPHAVRAAPPRGAARAQHEPLSPAAAETEAEFTAFLLADLEQTIVAMGPETVCLVHMEPVQNAGGCFTPPAGYWQGVREICDRYDILLSADEVITAFGRLGVLVRLGALRHPARHRHFGEGALVVLCRDRRGDRDRPGDGAVPRGNLDVHPRDHVRRPSRDVRDRAQEHRDHEARADRRARARDGGRIPGEARDAPRPRRSWATSAGRASSTGSSSSRTRRRARPSPTRSARRCSAGFSRRRSSTRG